MRIYRSKDGELEVHSELSSRSVHYEVRKGGTIVCVHPNKDGWPQLPDEALLAILERQLDTRINEHPAMWKVHKHIRKALDILEKIEHGDY